MLLAKAHFTSNDVHKQCAITLRTPPYPDKDITEPVHCAMYLYRPKNKTKSDPVDFFFVPSYENAVKDRPALLDKSANNSLKIRVCKTENATLCP